MAAPVRVVPRGAADPTCLALRDGAGERLRRATGAVHRRERHLEVDGPASARGARRGRDRADRNLRRRRTWQSDWCPVIAWPRRAGVAIPDLPDPNRYQANCSCNYVAGARPLRTANETESYNGLPPVGMQAPG